MSPLIRRARLAVTVLAVAAVAAACSSNPLGERAEQLDDVLDRSAFTEPEQDFIRNRYLAAYVVAEQEGQTEALPAPAAMPFGDMLDEGNDYCEAHAQISSDRQRQAVFDQYRGLPEGQRDFITTAHTYLCPEVPDPTIDPATLPPTPIPSATTVPTSTPVPTATPIPSPTPIPAIPAGSAHVIDPGIVDTQPISASLTDIGATITITGYGETNEAPLRSGAPVRPAASGQKLVAIDYAIVVATDAYSDGETSTLVIVGGGRDIHTDQITRSTTATVLVSVPINETPAVELRTFTATGEVVQRLNPATGQAAQTQVPALWSIAPDRRTQHVDQTFRLPLENNGPDAGSFPVEYGEHETTVTITSLHVADHIALAVDDEETRRIAAVAQPGRVLVTVAGTSDGDSNGNNGGRFDGPLTRPEQAVIVTADGTRIPARYADPDTPSRWRGITFFSTAPYWEVETAQLDGATIVITPSEVLTHTGGTETTVSYRDAAIEIPINLG